MFSVNKVPIRLTEKQWGHIIKRHPELKGQKEKITETISEPDFIQEGDEGTFISIRHYSKTPLTEKYCIVVYREVNKQEGFVITAYFATKPVKWRRTLWKR
ncbi:hypothetical protein HY02_01405 [Peptococcaceae bacterium SCADC1_2_3]|nr:hypothetical protein DK28_0204385 [Peptococcaceae bacterium SCADC1_2_3]KFI36517.1 hypothetical protein HY02_01405 [Peptococcaceae bacterium SCADC1_2_3]